jgi:hypothetical protein
MCHIQRSTFRRLQPSIIYTTTQTFSKILTSLAYIPRVKHLTFQGSKDVVQTGYESMLIRGSNLTEVRRYSKVGPVRTIFMPRSLESRYIRLEGESLHSTFVSVSRFSHSICSLDGMNLGVPVKLMPAGIYISINVDSRSSRTCGILELGPGPNLFEPIVGR